MRIAIFLLSSCAGREFADRNAEAYCGWRARCETLAEAGYESEEECVTQRQESLAHQDLRGELSCPGYDAAAADACLAVYEETPCEEGLEVGVCGEVCEG